MAEKITLVKTVNMVQFFGISGTQIAPTMGGGLDIKETPKGVSITSPSFPGKRRVIYNANIAEVGFADDGEAK
jgi:hypothetical protein